MEAFDPMPRPNSEIPRKLGKPFETSKVNSRPRFRLLELQYQAARARAADPVGLGTEEDVEVDLRMTAADVMPGHVHRATRRRDLGITAAPFAGWGPQWDPRTPQKT